MIMLKILINLEPGVAFNSQFRLAGIRNSINFNTFHDTNKICVSVIISLNWFIFICSTLRLSVEPRQLKSFKRYRAEISIVCSGC